MPRHRLTLLIPIALISGLLAVGCGGGETSTSTTSESGSLTPEAASFYETCTDTFKGSAAKGQAEDTCGEARDILDDCLQEADAASGSAADAAAQTCEDFADSTISTLEQSAGT